MTLRPDLRDAAFRWIADDPDHGTRAELQRVLAEAMAGKPTAVTELTDRMSGPLTFGTAGLRGPVRAGPNGMNVAVVVRTTAGLADWLRARGHAGGLVLVGRDARHGSERFASAAAGVLAAAGFQVRMLPRPLPTPVLAHLTRHQPAVAGIQITASHNPPGDNGYKLYLGDGTQIVPPADREIEAAISAVASAMAVPTSADWGLVEEPLIESYLDRVAGLPRGAARELRVVLTAMHGVGADTAVTALRRAGFTDVRLVAEQAEPDPDFPTVSFPNPEEPGAADLLLELAAGTEADLAIALDPDADRCALGVRERDGSWRMLRGDETGVLLGEHVLSTLDRTAHPDPLVATTIVSASQLESVARKHNVRYDETLTGFKWLVRSGVDGAGTGLVYAYEEALGHCVDPDGVRDKDGISAAVLACDLAAGLKAAGRSLLDALDELAAEHGVHLTDQVSVRVTELSQIGALMARLRARPPAELAGVAIEVEDLLPRTDGLRLTGPGVRVVVRPSGTEPKLKSYLQVIEPVAEPGLTAARRRAGERLADLRSAVTELLANTT
ncbi:phospho-sugar mutase [Goodfellowiella coeruleoviolacea]|uniref:Phosphomannomutase n=1 Tax=Goodfellowiella coeruleoviolacea TaxID=334858 RepID=A0AAE3KGG7_9PSEU|nr:phospho-sugar mutase [Goodfellowiella coeruleoviolacea]MCP2165454.1 phosphomannomutase [Goodfellowiella coeruleoviolacea]